MSYKSIEDFLKTENSRLDFAHRWLYWYDNGEWVVVYRAYGARENKTLYRGENLLDALAKLGEELV